MRRQRRSSPHYSLLAPSPSDARVGPYGVNHHHRRRRHGAPRWVITMTALILISILRGDLSSSSSFSSFVAEAFSIDPWQARWNTNAPLVGTVGTARMLTRKTCAGGRAGTAGPTFGATEEATADVSMAAIAEPSPPPSSPAGGDVDGDVDVDVGPPPSPVVGDGEEGGGTTPPLSSSADDGAHGDPPASPHPEVEAEAKAATAASSTIETKALLETGGGGGAAEAEPEAATMTTVPSTALAIETEALLEDAAIAEEEDGEAQAEAQAVAVLASASSALAASGAFAALVALSGPGAWRYYVAGGICASVSHAITTPIDVVKTRQQVDYNCPSDNLAQSFLFIVRNDGVRALLAGLGPTTVGYLFEGSIKFGIYEVLKPFVMRNLAAMAAATSSAPGGAALSALLCSRLFVFSVCAAVSGFAASVMLCPMEALRIRMVAEPHFARRGWVDGGVRMVRREGLGGLFKGLTAMAAKQVPYTITKQVSFDFFATRLYEAARGAGLAMDGRVRFGIPLVSAMLASILSCVASQPGDMLLSLVNAHEGRKRAREFARDIIRRDGLRGFLVGIKARFVHVGVIVTIQLLIYDFVKRLCGIAATGSAG